MSNQVSQGRESKSHYISISEKTDPALKEKILNDGTASTFEGDEKGVLSDGFCPYLQKCFLAFFCSSRFNIMLLTIPVAILARYNVLIHDSVSVFSFHQKPVDIL